MEKLSIRTINYKREDPIKNIIVTQQFTQNFIFKLFKIADYMKTNKYNVSNVLKNKVVAILFYESSTRTRFSFESAVKYLGGQCVTTENAKEFSSVSKGEILEDTIKTISNYADAIVMRHYEDDASERAVEVSAVPIINAGSGKAQHPTQALLDVYTIFKQFGRLNNLKIAIIGDLLRGRTCDSLIYLLSKFDDNIFYFVSPKNCKIKKSMKEHLKENNINYYEIDNLNGVLSKADICYMTRIQKERFDSVDEYEEARGKYIIDENNIEIMFKNSILMHPLPRLDEISTNVDKNSRSKYFEQVENGLYVRMALLKMMLGDNM